MAMQSVTLPAMPLAGGCQCGAVRYRVTGDPIVFYLCHCSECQRHTSSAFGESLRIHASDLEIEGPLKTVTRVAESGRVREGHFCAECGVRLYHGTAGAEQVNIKAETLDDTSWLIPAGHIWVRSKQPFFPIAADEPSYDEQPADGYKALTERWQAMTGEAN